MSEILALLALAALLGAAAALAWLWREERRPGRVSVLLYHRLVDDSTYPRLQRPENLFAIPESRFREQMDFLKRAGYSALDPAQLEAHLEGGQALPPRPVLITFDDGSESVHSRALPILRERGLKATVFVTTDEEAWVFHEHPRSQRRLSEREMRALVDAGLSVQAHGVSHRALNSMSEEEARREIVECRLYLERVLGKEVAYFAIPLNYYSRPVLEWLRDAGYRLVFTSDNGTNHAGSDPFRLRRFIVEGSAALEEFARLLTPTGMVQRRLISALKRLPPRIFGYRLWMPIRRVLYRSALGSVLVPRHLRRALILAGAALAACGLLALLLLLRRAG